MIRLDVHNLMAESIGPRGGLTEESLDRCSTKAQEGHRWLMELRDRGELAFFDLPEQREELEKVMELAQRLRPQCTDLVVLGIGGSSLGPRALHSALNPPFYNLLGRGERNGPRIFFPDNVDPEGFAGLLHILDWDGVYFNVVSKSGSTAETISQYLIVRGILEERLGREEALHRLILTTDPEKGFLRELIRSEGLQGLDIPPGVGGRFSVLTPVGLFPAAMVGIPVEGVLEGARQMAERCRDETFWENPAMVHAATHYLMATEKGRNICVMMPYADALYDVADWFRQLWAESLGKRLDTQGREVEVGQTPVKALGTTDQHSQVQLYLEGPHDKVIDFIRVERYREDLEIPGLHTDAEGVGYLGGRRLSELIQAEGAATEIALANGGRPSCTFLLPQIDPKSVGELFFLLEYSTALSGALYRINPFDQPGVEEGKHLTYGIMGRAGYEDKRKEVEERRPADPKYVI